MEANAWTLVLLGVLLTTLVIVILVRNKRDKDEFYKTLHAGEDSSLLDQKDATDFE